MHSGDMNFQALRGSGCVEERRRRHLVICRKWHWRQGSSLARDSRERRGWVRRDGQEKIWFWILCKLNVASFSLPFLFLLHVVNFLRGFTDSGGILQLLTSVSYRGNCLSQGVCDLPQTGPQLVNRSVSSWAGGRGLVGSVRNGELVLSRFSSCGSRCTLRPWSCLLRLVLLLVDWRKVLDQLLLEQGNDKVGSWAVESS